MNKMSIKKDDVVVVLSGKDKGKQGKVLEVMPKSGKVVVEKDQRRLPPHPSPASRASRAASSRRKPPIYACKVQRVCPKCNKSTRPAHKLLEGGKKVRVCKSAAPRSERGGVNNNG